MVATLLPLQEKDFLNYCVVKIAMTKSNSQRRIMQITMYAFECIILRKNQCVGTPRVIHKLHLSINPGQKIDAKISKQTKIKNVDLKFCSSFNKGTCKMIVGFLNHIQGPICAISHNRYGNEFQQLLGLIRVHGYDVPERFFHADFSSALRRINAFGHVNNTIDGVYKRLFGEVLPERGNYGQNQVIGMCRIIFYYGEKFRQSVLFIAELIREQTPYEENENEALNVTCYRF